MELILTKEEKVLSVYLINYGNKLRGLIEELQGKEISKEEMIIQAKALIEYRNLQLYLNGIVNEDYYRAYLEAKDLANMGEIELYLKSNEFQEFPVLYLLSGLGVSFESILKCLGKTKTEIVKEMKENGYSGNLRDAKKILLTTLIYHSYNKVDYFEKNPQIAKEFARILLKKKMFRSKIATLLNMTFDEIEKLK